MRNSSIELVSSIKAFDILKRNVSINLEEINKKFAYASLNSLERRNKSRKHYNYALDDFLHLTSPERSSKLGPFKITQISESKSIYAILKNG